MFIIYHSARFGKSKKYGNFPNGSTPSANVYRKRIDKSAIVMYNIRIQNIRGQKEHLMTL